MKPYLAFTLTLFCLLAYCEFAVCQNKKSLPDFTFQDLDGRKFSNKDLKKGKGMFVYFNPLCDICRAEMKVFRNNTAYFADKPVYMVSPEHLEDIRQFTKDFKIKKFTMIKVLHDSNDQFFKLFQTSGYPSIFIFNEHKEITASFIGETSFEEIKNAFEAKDNLVKDAKTNMPPVPSPGN